MWHFIPHVIVLVVDSSITLSSQAFKLVGISFLLPVTSLDVGMSLTQSRPELGRKDGRRSSSYRYLCPRKETDRDQNSFFFFLRCGYIASDTENHCGHLSMTQGIKQRTAEFINEVKPKPLVDIIEQLYQPTLEFTLPLNFLLCEITRFFII